ncbi:MAG TPA: hypothetical protein VOA78_07240 [Candidatus Dormibacteraeota bacterium]|nr:hypothetical protein [Candidatus Dormibacteraeota bacterium]
MTQLPRHLSNNLQDASIVQTELQIERQYNQALESQIRAFTESA